MSITQFTIFRCVFRESFVRATLIGLVNLSSELPLFSYEFSCYIFSYDYVVLRDLCKQGL